MILDQYSNLTQAALSYAARGWKIFPLRPLTKLPLLSGSWPEYATNEPWQVLEWWTRFPEANIAIVAGGTFTVIDVDRKPDKPDGWLQVGAFVDQTTSWVATPNNGFHFYYQNPGCEIEAKPGVDIQQGNHYTVAPPSRIHSETPEADIRPYRWGIPPDAGFRSFPPQLLTYLQRAEPNHATDTDQPLLSEHPPEMPLGALKPSHQVFLSTGEVTGFPSRSEVIHSLATRLYQLGHDDAQVLSMLWAAPYVQDTALEHRQGHESRALCYLWDSCRKVRHHKRKTVQEAFSAANVPHETAQGIKDKAMRLPPGGDVRGILQEIAVAKLDAFDEDRVLGVLKEAGYTKQVLIKTLQGYKAALRDQSKVLKWKHVAGEEQRPLGTVENLEILLAHKAVTVRYNLMEHKIEISNLHEQFGKEEQQNNQLTTIRSWATQYRMPFENIREQLIVLACKNEYHPFQEMIDRVTWDGIARVQTVIDTLGVVPRMKRSRNILVYRWFLSIIAATYGYGNRAPRGVLTFVGPQHIGKSTWLKYLVPANMYHQGHMLRADQRDSVVKGLRYLLVELGELGTTFKRQDIETLKNHIGTFEDVHRMPYAHTESIWPRRTVFAASANNDDLLKDQTGNTRWWVVPVTEIDLDAMESRWGQGDGRELLQFWKEVKILYDQGEKWDLTDQELAMLEEQNEEFRDVPPIEETLMDTYKWKNNAPEDGYPIPKTLTEIQRDMGVRNLLSPPDQYILREALRRLTGMKGSTYRKINMATIDGKEIDQEFWKARAHKKSSRVQGRYWYVPSLKGSGDTKEPFKP